METKRDIRARILEKRTHMTQEEWEFKSDLIVKRLMEHPFFVEAREIYCYMDYRREVGTRRIIEKAWELNKKTAVPKVCGDDTEFYYVQRFDELEKGYSGIWEPVTKKKAKGDSVLVLLPGSAFDRNRNRIGYGKGFYDKYLIKHQQYRTLALAFEFQVVDSIPTDSYDIRPDGIITEETYYV